MTDKAFTRAKSRFATTWAHMNVAKMRDMPCAQLLRVEVPTIHIVGAGPSLSWDYTRLGGMAMATNSSGMAMLDMGYKPDVVVIRESLDLSDQVEELSKAGVELFVLDIACHPATWEAAGDKAVWFIPLYPRHAKLADLLDVPMLAAGTAALTAAASLAFEWGAKHIELHGVDLAFAPEGQTYATGAPRGACTYELQGEVLELQGDTTEDDERCIASGQQPPPKRIAYTKCMSQDWSRELVSINVLDDQAEWLANAAERNPHVECINQSRGRGIPGWRARPTTLASPGYTRLPQHFDKVDPEKYDHAIRALIHDAIVGETISAELLSPRGPDLEMLGKVHGATDVSTFSTAMAAHKLVDIPHPGDTEAQSAVKVYTALREANSSAQALLQGRVPHEYK